MSKKHTGTVLLCLSAGLIAKFVAQKDRPRVHGAVGLACGVWGGNGASYGNTAGINSAGKGLVRRGLFNSAAQSYYRKTAHRLGGDFVLKPLFESLGKSALGTAAVTVKNRVRAKKNIARQAYHSAVCASLF